MSDQERARKNAREDGAKHLYEHEKRLGKDPSYESCQRHVNERADIQDKRKDWNIKD